MKNDKETKSKLLASAKEEFLEKGYMKASLRTICKNAGVTTGALYFFYKDKEDLFAALVEEPFQNLYGMMMNHYNDGVTAVKEGTVNHEDHSNDLEVAEMVAHYMYANYDAFELLLTKSQGSRFENCVDEFVQVTEQHYRKMADFMTSENGLPRVDDYLVHWISHMHIDSFIHMLKHERSEEKAKMYMKQMVQYFVHGWYGVFLPPKK